MTTTIKITLFWVVLCLLSAQAISESTHPDEQAARQVMSTYIDAFNARDINAWSATFHYPLVRLQGGILMIINQPSDIKDQLDFEEFSRSTGWHHSRWDHIRLISQGNNKVHFQAKFSRYDEDDNKLASYDALYVITQVDGRWGMQILSTYQL